MIAFVLIPGASVFAEPCFARVTPRLRSLGYEVHPTDLASVGERPKGPASFEDDVTQIAAQIRKLAEEGKARVPFWLDGQDVVVAMSSYGGFPGTQACKGLIAADRAKEGKKGGVVALAYLASFIPPPGKSIRDVMGESLPEAMKDSPNDYMQNHPESWRYAFCDVPIEEAQELRDKYFLPGTDKQSTKSFTGSAIDYPAYKFVDTYFLLGELDMVIPPATSHSMLEWAKNEGVEVKITSIKAGHAPFLTKVDETVEFLVKTVKTTGR
ncbi:alpha/beta-hydrolase [Atractiella rhizophila]|nr:alpha/beta-hydrolase [Atractiella rhizophila]